MAQKSSNRKRNTTRGNGPQPVVIVQESNAQDTMRFDRVMTALTQSQSLIDLLVDDQFSIDVSSTISPGVGLTYNFVNIVATDDFQSLLQQYNLFRVKGIRFDIYDTNPNTGSGTAFFSTYHVAGGQTQNMPALNDVVDGPDSGIVPPGQGKLSLTWMSKDIHERDFQATASPGAYTNYGGLRAYVTQGTTATTARWRVIVKAHVQFRGRV